MNYDKDKHIREDSYTAQNNDLNVGRGCKFEVKNEETTAVPCESCYKLHTTDWLADYPDVNPNDIFEVRFKNTHRSYYKNVYNLPLHIGDIVAVEASPGHDIGIISLTGDMVAKQMRRVGFNPQNGEFKKIYRKAKPYDIERWQEAISLEHETMIRSRQIAADMNLNMKIGDVEYQGDKIKAIFYYIADERVDFRELIKVFAEQFHIRVEMKQIGARQEAGRIGGLGSCGRQLCCASWISNFVSVTTNAAHLQDLSLNPQKLAGQCSKLKCCLIYEIDSYIDARKDFPKLDGPLQALDADYYLVKTDILGHTMSFSTTPNSLVNMIKLPVSKVKEILRLNAAGKKPESINIEDIKQNKEEPGFVNVIGEESITRFDNTKKKKRKKKKKSGKEEINELSDSQGQPKQNDESENKKTNGQNNVKQEENGKNDRMNQSQTKNDKVEKQSNKTKNNNGKSQNISSSQQEAVPQQQREKEGGERNKNKRRHQRSHKKAEQNNELNEKPKSKK